MSTIHDLCVSITEMSFEEAQELISRARFRRRNPPAKIKKAKISAPTQSKPKRSASKTRGITQRNPEQFLTPEQAQQLFNLLQGASDESN